MLHVCSKDNQTGNGRNRRIPKKSSVSWVIMLILVVIALGIYMKQFEYDAALFSPDAFETEIVSQTQTSSPGFPDIQTFMYYFKKNV